MAKWKEDTICKIKHEDMYWFAWDDEDVLL